MYQKAYLILAHDKPDQLFELISLLDDGSSCFFIHLDKNAALSDFKKSADLEKCHFVQRRIRCRWGDYSLVKATLNGMEELSSFMRLNHPQARYHCVLLSGSDLPVKNNLSLHRFLESDPEASYLHFWKLPYEKWWGGGFFRLENLYLFNHVSHKKAHKWVNKIVRKLRFDSLLPLSRIEKKYPGMPIYGSSQWMILSDKALGFILETEKKSGFSACFRYTFAPDELYFATLLLNFPKDANLSVKNCATHFVKFEEGASNASYLSAAELQDEIGANHLFARKFDRDINPDAIALVHKMLKK